MSFLLLSRAFFLRKKWFRGTTATCFSKVTQDLPLLGECITH